MSTSPVRSADFPSPPDRRWGQANRLDGLFCVTERTEHMSRWYSRIRLSSAPKQLSSGRRDPDCLKLEVLIQALWPALTADSGPLHTTQWRVKLDHEAIHG